MYTISDKKYVIRPLVLGQLRQLSALLEDIVFPSNFTVMDLIRILGDKLPTFLAIILVEEGKKLSEKDLKQLEKDIEENVDVETSLKMVEDFFDIIPIQSLLNKIVSTTNKILGVKTETTETGLIQSA